MFSEEVGFELAGAWDGEGADGAGPFPTVELHFVGVPFGAGGEELIWISAVGGGADVGFKIRKDMFPGNVSEHLHQTWWK